MLYWGSWIKLVLPWQTKNKQGKLSIDNNTKKFWFRVKLSISENPLFISDKEQSPVSADHVCHVSLTEFHAEEVATLAGLGK